MKYKIKEYIMKGNFLEAQRDLKSLDCVIFKQILLEIACDEVNICAYAFMCFLIQKQETAYYHSLASLVLNIAFCHLEGGYHAAAYHTRRALELDPDDVASQEMLIFFNRVPEKVVSTSEAIQVAKNILLKDPENQIARKYLDEFEKNIKE